MSKFFQVFSKEVSKKGFELRNFIQWSVNSMVEDTRFEDLLLQRHRSDDVVRRAYLAITATLATPG